MYEKKLTVVRLCISRMMVNLFTKTIYWLKIKAGFAKKEIQNDR